MLQQQGALHDCDEKTYSSDPSTVFVSKAPCPERPHIMHTWWKLQSLFLQPLPAMWLRRKQEPEASAWNGAIQSGKCIDLAVDTSECVDWFTHKGVGE